MREKKWSTLYYKRLLKGFIFKWPKAAIWCSVFAMLNHSNHQQRFLFIFKKAEHILFYETAPPYIWKIGIL